MCKLTLNVLFSEVRFWKSWSVWISISRTEPQAPPGLWPDREIFMWIWTPSSGSVGGSVVISNWKNPFYKIVKETKAERLYRRIGRAMRLLCTSRATAPFFFLGVGALIVFLGYVTFKWNTKKKEKKRGV